MDREQREEYMIKLLQNITPDEVVEPETKIRGTTIKKLCEYNAGGYKRVIEWLENQQPKEAVDPIISFYDECKNLYIERKDKYGESWKVLSPHAIANLIEMKANRAAKMGDTNAKSLDEAKDMANYAAMLHCKLQEVDK